MSRSVRAVPVILLALALVGCAAGVAATSAGLTARLSAVFASDEDSGSSDLSSGRAQVTNDGLMVRRREVIAIHTVPGANLVSLRKELDDAAARGRTSLSSISPAVLDPALLEPRAPELTLLLPPGQSLAEVGQLVDPAASKGPRFPDVSGYHIVSVLVHDLRFTVSSATPAVLAENIAQEGILSDALGSYAATLGRYEVDFTYTGPLLSNDLVDSVRAGIARLAHTLPAAVTISPRSTTGVGVDLAKEPALPRAATQASTALHHDGAALAPVKASSQSSRSSLWAVAVAALAALLLATLVLLRGARSSPSVVSGRRAPYGC